MAFDYKKCRSEITIKRAKELPKGQWMTFTEAGKYFGRTAQCVRIWALEGKMQIIRYKHKMYVRIDNVKMERW